MARLPRLSLPSIPQHVIQRGNNRQACFYADDDYRFYRKCLGEAARKYRVSVHAYVLMTHPVHLLMTPSSAAGTSRVMQTLGRRYARYINHTYRRSGTL
jgi:putative transposase